MAVAGRKHINANLEYKMVQKAIISEEKHKQEWPYKWGWILCEYEALHDELQKISRLQRTQPEKDPEMEQKLKNMRLPETENQVYGWRAAQPELLLDKYGPDYMRPKRITPDVNFSAM